MVTRYITNGESIMKVGDLVRLIDTFVTVDFINVPETKIVMIIEGPNEVGNIKVLLQVLVDFFSIFISFTISMFLRLDDFLFIIGKY